MADGAVLHTLVLPACKDGGAVAGVRGFVGDTERGITAHSVWVRNYSTEGAKLDRLRQQAEDGTVTLRVARTFPAEEAPAAFEMLDRSVEPALQVVLDFEATP